MENLHCWRPYNTIYNQSNVNEEARSRHVPANIWGWINYRGVGYLVEINEKCKSQKYIEIREEVMLASVRCHAIPYPEII